MGYSFENRRPLFRRGLLFVISVALLLVAGFAEAQAQVQNRHQLIRRVVVFPVKAPPEYAALAEEAWWQAREQLAQGRRLLVASKQFLIKKDVFQSRGELEPADVVILGKLLDAHALVTIRLTGERKLILSVFDGANGLVLWTKTVALHPSVTVLDQLLSLTRKIVDDFLATVPYQGFTIVDPLNDRAVYQEGESKLAQIDLGAATGAQIGDAVHWIHLSPTNAAPLFQGGAKMTVFAEGRILRIEQGIATVEVLRASSLESLLEYSLVRIPREAERLANQFAMSDQQRGTLPVELVAPEKNPMEEVAREKKPLVASMSFISSLVAFLLLAF
jgi:hypothetical protein